MTAVDHRIVGGLVALAGASMLVKAATIPGDQKGLALLGGLVIALGFGIIDFTLGGDEWD